MRREHWKPKDQIARLTPRNALIAELPSMYITNLPSTYIMYITPAPLTKALSVYKATRHLLPISQMLKNKKKKEKERERKSGRLSFFGWQGNNTKFLTLLSLGG